ICRENCVWIVLRGQTLYSAQFPVRTICEPCFHWCRWAVAAARRMAVLPPASQRTVAHTDRALVAGWPGAGPAARARGMILPEADLAAAIPRRQFASLDAAPKYFHHRLLEQPADRCHRRPFGAAAQNSQLVP